MCRVIIADDEPKVLLLIRNLIQWEELGLELVATANDGISALDLIEELHPDIVITDIRMPGYDGIELIEKAKALDPRIDFIIISGYRHFNYAQKAIRFGVEDYLLKPLKALEINQTLRKMTEKYKERDKAKQREEQYSARIEDDAKKRQEQFIASLLAEKSDGAAPATVDSVNEEFGLDFKVDAFQAFIVKTDVYYASLNPNVRKLLMEKSMGVIKDALQGKCHAFLLHPTEHGIYGLVNFSEAQKKTLRKAMVAIIDALQSQSELFDRIKVTIGLGHQAEVIDEMAASVKEAEYAVANRLIHGAGRIIDRTGGQESAELVRQMISAPVRSSLLKGVEILDDREIRTVFDALAEQVAGNEAMTGKAIAALCEECVQILRFGLKSQNSVDEWVDEKQADFFEKFGMCNTQKDVFQLLGSYASSLITHVAARRKSENSKPIREAQKYIQENFGSAINLESISQKAGFNATYFSLLFKKETGMNFLEYLTDVRIKEAKLMLADPRKSIADVAEAVGYSDVKHFSKLFTRSTGIHPSKFRKLYY
jgi:two-component system response regulator YesN